MPDAPSNNEDTPEGTGRTPAPWLHRMLLVIVAPAAALLLGELALRLIGFHYPVRTRILAPPQMISGFIGTLEFHIGVSMKPPGYIWASQSETDFTDKNGFRLPSVPYAREPGKIRIAFLGGSTTQGGYRPYPERAVRLLNRVAGSNRYEALNVACSSYTTHQSLIALRRWVLPRKPDVVFIYHGWNDAMVAPDGFADHHKDRLVGRDGQPRASMPSWLMRWRLAGMAAMVTDIFAPPWPEQRVPLANFAANLETMAGECHAQGIRTILMTRPGEAAGRMKRDAYPASSLEQRHAQQAYGIDDPVQVYQRKWMEMVDIQRAAAERHSYITLFDGANVVSSISELASEGFYGERVPIFHGDSIHLYDFADELLAQQVAMAIAPEWSAAISNEIAGVSYLKDLATELIDENSPREAAWCIRQAMIQHPGTPGMAELTGLLQRAESNVEFADHFREGRWGGAERDFAAKMAHLKRCMEIRPDDFGVMAQMYRVCKYMDHVDEIAEAILPYQPQTPQESRLYFSALLESHIAAGREGPARESAEQLLKIKPDDKLALSIMESSQP